MAGQVAVRYKTTLTVCLCLLAEGGAGGRVVGWRTDLAHHGSLALGLEDALLNGFRPGFLQRALLLRRHVQLLCSVPGIQAWPGKSQS